MPSAPELDASAEDKVLIDKPAAVGTSFLAPAPGQEGIMPPAPQLSAVIGQTPVTRIPQEAWFALTNCIARQSRVRRYYLHAPVEGVGGVDKYIFRFNRELGIIDMRVIYGFLNEGSVSDRLKEATTASGAAHHKRERARQALERVQSEAAPYLNAEEYDTPPEAGTPRYVAEETKKRFIALIDKSVAALEAATADAEAAVELVAKVQAEKAKGREEHKRFTLEDLEAGRVLPVFPVREAVTSVA